MIHVRRRNDDEWQCMLHEIDWKQQSFLESWWPSPKFSVEI
jgi:hypothetical protein